MRTVGGNAALSWRSLESWVGTWSSAIALFSIGLLVFALESVVLPVQPGRDMSRYVQAFIQLGYAKPVLTSVADTRGPLASLGVGIPLELGGIAAEVWLAILFAASVVAWSAVANRVGPRTAVLTAVLLLLDPGYGILFHGLASDALFAAAFAGWALLLTRAIERPEVVTFAVAGLGMGGLVLVRPGNQALIVMTFLPILLRASWGERARWAAAFFVGSTAVTQGWKAVMTLRYGDATALRPSGVFLVVALALVVLMAAGRWRKWLVVAAIPLLAVGVVARGGIHPVDDARTLLQGPSTSVFLYRIFEVDRIASPDNGPESRRLADIIERDLLTKEPYRSYGVTIDDVFTAGSERIFGDVGGLSGGVDPSAVAEEAIRSHPRAFATGIARTAWTLFRAQVFALPVAPPGEQPAGAGAGTGSDESFVVVNGRKLPAPSEGQPIPASHFGPVLYTLYGDAGEVWRSPTDHRFVFDDPRDEQRYEAFNDATDRLVDRIPTREANATLVHRLNQASRAFPPPVVWLVVGIVALALRRPRRALIAIAPAIAALAVILGTALVAFPVGEYSIPVSPAFILLAAAGLVGAARRRVASPGRDRTPV